MSNFPFLPSLVGTILVQSKDMTSANTDSVTIKSGNTDGNGFVTGDVLISSGDVADSNSGNVSGNLSLISGNAFTSAGGITLQTGNSSVATGAISLILGSAPGGTGANINLFGYAPGQIVMQDSSQGTPGSFWTSIGSSGEGSWLPLISPSGATGSRPGAPVLGQMYFDTSLALGNGMPIWYNGTNWVNAAGVIS